MLRFEKFDRRSGEFATVNPRACFFGITESIALAIGSFLTTAGVAGTAATGLAGTLGAVGSGALVGAGLGAAEAGITGKDPLKGAEFGAVSGGVASGVSPLIGDVTGLGSTATGAISGALGGVAGGLATGGNIGTDALTGGLAGAVGGALKPDAAPAATGSTPTGGPVGSAASNAAPSSIGAAPGTGAAVEGLSSGGVAAPDIGSSIGTPPPGSAGAGYNTGSLSDAVGATPAGTAPVGTVQAPNIPSGVSASTLPTATPNLPSPGIGSQIGGFIKDNPWAIPAAAIGYEALKGTQPLPGQSQIEANAAKLNQQGASLQNYFQSGTLPPGVQSGINSASEAAKASIRSMYASRGMSGSSAEQQDIGAVDSRAQTQGSQIALSLLQQGVSETGMANQLYLELMGNALQQDQALGSALATFSAAMIPALAA